MAGTPEARAARSMKPPLRTRHQDIGASPDDRDDAVARSVAAGRDARRSTPCVVVAGSGPCGWVRPRAHDSGVPGPPLSCHTLYSRFRSMRENALYPPVKAFLEAQGYAVKGEVNGCDLVVTRDREPLVIVELKTGFSLPLVFQGIARQNLSDTVYLAVPPFSVRTARWQDALALCRRLGLGLLTVRLKPTPFVEALLDPAPYRPRKRQPAIGRLLREFQQRMGDPNEGGSNRRKIMTAYRQDALRCAAHLRRTGAAKVARDTGVARAGAMMRADHYGWFERPADTSRGVYDLTPKGQAALEEYADTVAVLECGGS